MLSSRDLRKQLLLLSDSSNKLVESLASIISSCKASLTSLVFLGLGVPPGTPSLGELLAQGKGNLDAWWISLSTFVVLVSTLLLLTFMGEALRDAFDSRKSGAVLGAR
jgi:microcin C transport system permease protein